jgi:hypothetical protein
LAARRTKVETHMSSSPLPASLVSTGCEVNLPGLPPYPSQIGPEMIGFSRAARRRLEAAVQPGSIMSRSVRPPPGWTPSGCCRRDCRHANVFVSGVMTTAEGRFAASRAPVRRSHPPFINGSEDGFANLRFAWQCPTRDAFLPGGVCRDDPPGCPRPETADLAVAAAMS